MTVTIDERDRPSRLGAKQTAGYNVLSTEISVANRPLSATGADNGSAKFGHRQIVADAVSAIACRAGQTCVRANVPRAPRAQSSTHRLHDETLIRQKTRRPLRRRKGRQRACFLSEPRLNARDRAHAAACSCR